MCIHAIYKRSERDVKSIAATDKAWASVWVVETEKLVLKESGYDDDGVDMPMDTWIWRKGSNGLYCFCPATDSIYSVIMENNAAKSLLKAVQLSVEPPLLITGRRQGERQLLSPRPDSPSQRQRQGTGIPVPYQLRGERRAGERPSLSIGETVPRGPVHDDGRPSWQAPRLSQRPRPRERKPPVSFPSSRGPALRRSCRS